MGNITDKERLNRLKKSNPGLIFRYAYKREGELRFVFRDVDMLHYEYDKMGTLLDTY